MGAALVNDFYFSGCCTLFVVVGRLARRPQLFFNHKGNHHEKWIAVVIGFDCCTGLGRRCRACTRTGCQRTRCTGSAACSQKGGQEAPEKENGKEG
jgi:hypothetical protein